MLWDEKATECEESNTGSTYYPQQLTFLNLQTYFFTFPLERLLKCFPFTGYLCVDTEVEDTSEMLDIRMAAFMTTNTFEGLVS